MEYLQHVVIKIAPVSNQNKTKQKRYWLTTDRQARWGDTGGQVHDPEKSLLSTAAANDTKFLSVFLERMTVI